MPITELIHVLSAVITLLIKLVELKRAGVNRKKKKKR